jgi:hypothetical protein
VAGGSPPSGEFKLFFAILEDALRCYVRSRDCRSAGKRAEFLDAHVWFHTRGTPHLFCFESVCSFLGIDPDWLRERLKSLTPTDFPLKQYRTRRRRSARSAVRREATAPPIASPNAQDEPPPTPMDDTRRAKAPSASSIISAVAGDTSASGNSLDSEV